MVKIKEKVYLREDGSIDISLWLNELTLQYMERDIYLIKQALILSEHIGGNHPCISEDRTCLQQGLHMAELLVDLNADQTTVAAGILYHNVVFADLNLDDVEEQLNSSVAKLISGAIKMAAISTLSHFRHQDNQQRQAQINNLRKMLLAMVDDVRVVLLKLAERTCTLRSSAKLDETFRQMVAHETMDVYAPLANRLGLAQMKWELEDLAFRYIKKEEYKQLAKQLDQKRLDRERYIHSFKEILLRTLQDEGLENFQITGRVKHIYSIYRKMQRKGVDYNKIYDASAVRVLVATIEECYKVLSVIHDTWEHIPEEFDDYISNPKPNGYRSLHTAVWGPEHRPVEVQIRTFDIHNESELGVTAHWKYKEGKHTITAYEEKISWLRQLLDWQNELSQGDETQDKYQIKDLFEDRVYVFTPTGDIVDLAKGSTPLDFAYQIHSEIGHRCRGAKINGNLVPLTHTLNTGDKIEILTHKNPNPSRDWLNPHSGYLTSSRAKAKVIHWFRLQNYDDNVAEGQTLLEPELHKHHISKAELKPIATALHFKSANDLAAALGNGDIKLSQIQNKLEEAFPIAPKKEAPLPIFNRTSEEKPRGKRTDISIQGIDNLLTNIAKCCKPIPGDPIIGLITKTKGISIHHNLCHNILHTPTPEKLISLSWNDKISDHYAVDLLLRAEDRQDLIKDISSVISNIRVKLLHISTYRTGRPNEIDILLTVEVMGNSELAQFTDKLARLKSIIAVNRKMNGDH